MKGKIEVPFGTETNKKILFFLLQNEKCYSAELVRIFSMHGSRARKALVKLEKEGILRSYREGRNHLYRFDPKCFFIKELKSLLKKLYKNLPQNEKEKYYENKKTRF